MVGKGMRRIRNLGGPLLRAEDAQDLIEYALLCAMLSIACIGGILKLSRLVEFFTELGTLLAAVI
jgi:Flp pilus assembly pilin Flp